jgi:hypothetical protein
VEVVAVVCVPVVVAVVVIAVVVVVGAVVVAVVVVDGGGVWSKTAPTDEVEPAANTHAGLVEQMPRQRTKIESCSGSAVSVTRDW